MGVEYQAELPQLQGARSLKRLYFTVSRLVRSQQYLCL